MDRRAGALVEEPIGGLTVAQQYRAIDEALRSDARLSAIIHVADPMIDQHGEQDVRDFLRRILLRLDTIRPGPQSPPA